MKQQIKTTYEHDINAFIVMLPEYTTLDELHRWKKDILDLLCERREPRPPSILLDSNTHQFESIECLKYLRQLISVELISKNKISNVAFVSPRKYREPGIVSPIEGYFFQFEDAYRWLGQGDKI